MGNISEELKCSGCTKPLPNKEITCLHCKNEYHYLPCAGVRETTYAGWSKAKKLDWKCTSCKMKTRLNSGYESEATTKRARENDEEENGKGKQQRADNDNDDNHDMIREIKEIKKLIVDMDSKMEFKNNDLRKKMMENFNTFTDTITKLMKQINELTEENKEKDKRLSTLEIRVNELEQQALENNIEISNIAQEENENLINVIQNITKPMDIEINTNDIKDVYRNHKKNIIIKLTNRQKKKKSCKEQKRKNYQTMKATKFILTTS